MCVKRREKFLCMIHLSKKYISTSLSTLIHEKKNLDVKEMLIETTFLHLLTLLSPSWWVDKCWIREKTFTVCHFTSLLSTFFTFHIRLGFICHCDTAARVRERESSEKDDDEKKGHQNVYTKYREQMFILIVTLNFSFIPFSLLRSCECNSAKLSRTFQLNLLLSLGDICAPFFLLLHVCTKVSWKCRNL